MQHERPKHFYICIYLKEGRPIGHRGNFKREFPEKLHDDKTGDDRGNSRSGIKRSGYEDISRDFIRSMMGYLEYVPLILMMGPIISHQMVTSSMQQYLEANSSSCERLENRIIYDFPIEKFASVERFQENLKAATTTSRALPRMLTVGLVASLEYHLGLIMKEIAARNPEPIFGREKTLPVHEIVKFGSIEELKEHLINDEIDKTQRENFDAQVGWIISKADMEDFRPKYKEWPRLLELLERRNLFVHANGIVNDTYLRACARYKFPDAEERALGDELHAGPKYYNSSVQEVILFGAMLLQVVWRKSAPEETARADRAIGDLGYELIARGQYKLAIKILEFARSLRKVSSEKRRLMCIVNLANAHKLAKDETAAMKVLGEEDWSASGNEFKICVAAVKNKVDDVIELMERLGDRGEVEAQDYQEWPVFYGVRDDPRFISTFKAIFGFDYVPSARKQAGVAQVMDWIKNPDFSPDVTEDPTGIEVSSISERYETKIG